MKSYKSFEMFINSFRMSLKMHLKIIKWVFVVHALVLAVFIAVIYQLAPDSEKAIFKEELQLNVRSIWKGELHTHLTELLSFKKIIKAGYISILTWGLYPLLLLFFYVRTQDKFKEKLKRGPYQVTERELGALLPKESGLKLSSHVQLPFDYETRHFFVGGASGTGKTNLLSHVIEQLIARQEKLLLYDAKDGEFVAKFYRPQIDSIFNPFDARSVRWNVFDAVKGDADFESLAASIIPPHEGRDKFFYNAAQDILTAIFRYCYTNGLRENSHVWDMLNCGTTKLYQRLVAAGENAAAVDIENPDNSQTQGVMSTLIQYAKIFKYVSSSKGQPFSLSEWVKQDNSSGTIFLPNNVNQQQSLRGILSLFINSFARHVLSMNDDPGRRFFIVLDEFGTLARMDAVKTLVSLGRSKGCSFWIGIQEKAQIDDIYGKSISNSIINQCNNYLIFRMNDYESAEYFSRLFGEKELEVMESTHSAGIEDYRDGESYRSIHRKERLVLPSEIQGVADFHYFVKLHSYPLSTSGFAYKSYDNVQPSFVPNDEFYFSPQQTDKDVPKEKQGQAERTSDSESIKKDDSIEIPSKNINKSNCLDISEL